MQNRTENLRAPLTRDRLIIALRAPAVAGTLAMLEEQGGGPEDLADAILETLAQEESPAKAMGHRYGPDRNCLGYLVVEINQASHRPERVTTDFLHEDREWAEEVAGQDRAEAARTSRRERYIVCELVPVEEDAR